MQILQIFAQLTMGRLEDAKRVAEDGVLPLVWELFLICLKAIFDTPEQVIPVID
jgi:hypothetical protein